MRFKRVPHGALFLGLIFYHSLSNSSFGTPKAVYKMLEKG